MPKTQDPRSTAEKLADAKQKSLDAAKKITLANQRALAVDAQLAKLELDAARETINAESLVHRRKVAIGAMVLSWVSDATENMSAEELKSKLEEYLATDADIEDVIPIERQIDSIMQEEE
jgi:hypothetical protein